MKSEILLIDNKVWILIRKPNKKNYIISIYNLQDKKRLKNYYHNKIKDIKAR